MDVVISRSQHIGCLLHEDFHVAESIEHVREAIAASGFELTQIITGLVHDPDGTIDEWGQGTEFL